MMRKRRAGLCDGIEGGARRNAHVAGAQEGVDQQRLVANKGWNPGGDEPCCIVETIVMKRIEPRRNEEGGRQPGIVGLVQGMGELRLTAPVDVAVVDNVGCGKTG